MWWMIHADMADLEVSIMGGAMLNKSVYVSLSVVQG